MSGAARAPEVVLEWRTRIGVPRARVFAALSEAHHLEQWFCDRAESEPEQGGRLAMRWNRTGETFEGHWEHVDRPFACRYSGGHSGHPGADAGRVSFVLEPDGPSTLLSTRHTLPGGPEHAAFAERYRDAWPRALARLIAYLTPESRP